MVGQEVKAVMNDAERIVLEEMKRVLATEADNNSKPGPQEEIDFTQVPDGELLKCLRARRCVSSTVFAYLFQRFLTDICNPMHI